VLPCSAAAQGVGGVNTHIWGAGPSGPRVLSAEPRGKMGPDGGAPPSKETPACKSDRGRGSHGRSPAHKQGNSKRPRTGLARKAPGRPLRVKQGPFSRERQPRLGRRRAAPGGHAQSGQGTSSAAQQRAAAALPRRASKQKRRRPRRPHASTRPRRRRLTQRPPSAAAARALRGARGGAARGGLGRARAAAAALRKAPDHRSALSAPSFLKIPVALASSCSAPPPGGAARSTEMSTSTDAWRAVG
jgi:hypothetical protein